MSALALAQSDSGTSLQEIVVTAEKRESTVQNTPISMTAISGADLTSAGTASVEQLAATTPGISMRTSGPGQTEFEMRGLASSGGAAPTVGFYLDEVPLSPSSNSLNGRVVIDPDLYDLDRVEVLRGPQGTLYGSGSMGGTIKLVTNQPKLGIFESSADASLSGTQGGGVNPGASAMVNLPLGDLAALRLVGTYKYTSGWIDRVVENPYPFPYGTCSAFAGEGCYRGNVAAGHVSQVIHDTNSENLDGGRASLLFQPSDSLSFSTTLMYQGIRASGYPEYQIPPSSFSNPILAIYQPYNIEEPISDEFTMLSETVNFKTPFADITSATSYWTRKEDQSQDATEALENLNETVDANGNAAFLPISYREIDKSRQLSEELRLTSNATDSRFDWVAGVFYSRETSTYITINQSSDYAYLAVGGAAADPAGIVFNDDNPYMLEQYAIFGEGSYKITPSLKATAGLRWFDFKTHESYSQAGIDSETGNASALTGTLQESASGYNPKFNLSYQPTGDLTVYGTIARGFRPGGVSLPIPEAVGATPCGTVPLTYKPDNVWNYELGEKARLLDNRLVINADVYDIEWNDIQQIVEVACGYPYTANAGKARSYGPELEMTGRITQGLTANLSAAWTSSKIVHANPATPITDGTPTLNTPKDTFSATLTYDQPVFDNFTWTSRVTDSYVGTQNDIAFYPITLPSYNLIDVRTGITGASWATYLFVGNLTNKHAALTTNDTSFAWQVPDIVRVTTNQPRTFGIDVQYKFGGK